MLCADGMACLMPSNMEPRVALQWPVLTGFPPGMAAETSGLPVWKTVAESSSLPLFPPSLSTVPR